MKLKELRKHTDPDCLYAVVLQRSDRLELLEDIEQELTQSYRNGKAVGALSGLSLDERVGQRLDSLDMTVTSLEKKFATFEEFIARMRRL